MVLDESIAMKQQDERQALCQLVSEEPLQSAVLEQYNRDQQEVAGECITSLLPYPCQVVFIVLHHSNIIAERVSAEVEGEDPEVGGGGVTASLKVARQRMEGEIRKEKMLTRQLVHSARKQVNIQLSLAVETKYLIKKAVYRKM